MYIPSVLLVGDNITQARVLQKCVEQLDLHPLGPASNAAEALYLYLNSVPAMAIIDVDLNGHTTAIDVAQQLRLLGPLPIIFISTINNEKAVAGMWSVKPLIVLDKPLDFQFLQRVIKAVLNEPCLQKTVE